LPSPKQMLPQNGHSRLFKVIHFGIIEEPVSTYPTLIQHPRSGWLPSNFGMNLISAKTRIMGLPYGEESVIVCSWVWQMDRRTDRQMHRFTITKTAINSSNENYLVVNSETLPSYKWTLKFKLLYLLNHICYFNKICRIGLCVLNPLL